MLLAVLHSIEVASGYLTAGEPTTMIVKLSLFVRISKPDYDNCVKFPALYQCWRARRKRIRLITAHPRSSSKTVGSQYARLVSAQG
jgi:hypothetical protein